MNNQVVLLMGAGQIGLAIARRIASGKKIIVGDISPQNIDATVKTLVESGFDAEGKQVDLSSRKSLIDYLDFANTKGEIFQFINAAGVSPSQTTVKKILEIDLYGTAVLLEEVGKRIAAGGSGVTISSQSGHRMKALTSEEDELLALRPTEELLSLDMLKDENIENTLHAYQMAKRCNVKRVMAEAVSWGQRGHALILFLLALSSPHLPLMSLMAREAHFIKTCSENALQKDPARQMKWHMSPNFCSASKGLYYGFRFFDGWRRYGIVFLRATSPRRKGITYALS